MSNDADQDMEKTPEGDGSEETQDSKGSDPAAEIASYRKRQAGAEAARQIAEAKWKDAEKELAKYREANQTQAQKDLTDLARETARAEAAEKRAEEAETKAEARILDARFPNARKKLPEVTDEVRLAEFEAMLTESEPPTPMQHSESKSSAGTATPKPETAKEIAARLEKMPLPQGW